MRRTTLGHYFGNLSYPETHLLIKDVKPDPRIDLASQVLKKSSKDAYLCIIDTVGIMIIWERKK